MRAKKVWYLWLEILHLCPDRPLFSSPTNVKVILGEVSECLRDKTGVCKTNHNSISPGYARYATQGGFNSDNCDASVY